MMLEYTVAATLLKSVVGAWALFETFRVMRAISTDKRNLFYLLASLSLLLVGVALGGAWFTLRGSVALLGDPCQSRTELLSTSAAVAVNVVDAIAAAVAGITARKICYIRDYENMSRLILWASSVMLFIVLFVGAASRFWLCH